MLYIVIILFVVFSGVLAVVAFENFTTQVQISVFTWQSPYFPLGLLLLLAFVLGAVLLYLVTAASAWSDWRELRLLRRRIGELEASLNARAATSAMPVAQTPSPAPEVPAAQPVPASSATPEASGSQTISNAQNVQSAPNSPNPSNGPVVPMPGMPAKPDISDMPTQH